MSYKKLGDYIQQVNNRNRDLQVDTLLGVSITKKLIPSIANTVGTDMSTYKIIEKGQFAYGSITSRNGDKISIALADEFETALVSQIYIVFEVIDKNELLPEYLMMWFSRPEFDRYARYHSHGSTREAFDWEDLCNVELPVPFIEKQREIVAQYQAVANKISVNEQICEKLEATAQTLYKQWFIDFEFPITKESHPELVSGSHPQTYKSSGGAMVFNEELEKEIPEGWDELPISNYINVNSGFAFKSDWWTNSGIPVIKIGTIKNNSLDDSELAYINKTNISKSIKSCVEKGDIVIAMTGFTMGKIGLIPDKGEKIYVNQRVGYFKTGNNAMNNVGYLYCVLKTKEFQNQIWSFGGDSQQFNVSNNQVDSIKILQSFNRQLVDNFNYLTAPMFKKLIFSYSITNKLTQLQSLLFSRLARLQA